MKHKILRVLGVVVLVVLVCFTPQAEARIYVNVGSNCGFRYERPRVHCHRPIIIVRPPAHCHPHYQTPCRPRYVSPPCYRRPPVRVYRPVCPSRGREQRRCR